jgi:methylated-DNA-[protein]-cysteine S-methyltransferase
VEYLHGDRQAFDLPIDWSSLPASQAEVLRLVDQIPFGQVRTYGQIAVALGKPGASRAVGNANAHNPLPLIIPCHRVMGADGNFRGYGGPGGIPTKAWLLQKEGALLVP